MTTDKLGSAEYPADDVDLRTGVDVTKPETLKEAVQGETLDPRPSTLDPRPSTRLSKAWG